MLVLGGEDAEYELYGSLHIYLLENMFSMAPYFFISTVGRQLVGYDFCSVFSKVNTCTGHLRQRNRPEPWIWVCHHEYCSGGCGGCKDVPWLREYIQQLDGLV
jgi:hypothetical protein